MRVLFLTLELPDISSSRGGFYADMIQQLARRGHDVYVVSKVLSHRDEGLHKEGDVSVLRVNVPFLRKNTSLFRKALGSIMMTPCYIRAIKKYLSDISFDFIIVPTPPNTLVDVVKRVKKNAKVYLILRDIQPECAERKVSPKIKCRNDVYDECKKPFGINPIARHYLYRKSQQLYRISDLIGCMSPGNIDFVKKIAPYVDDSRLKLLPNWYSDQKRERVDTSEVRKKYNLENKFVAIYGGNIGPQQAIWNIAQLAKMNKDKKDVVILVVGRGVKKQALERIAREDHLTNLKIMKYMPREDYEAILQTADLGLISLDEKYVVPTCPSKIIGYMALAKPVLAMFNKGSDYGDFYIDKPGCGLWSVNLDHDKMQENFNWFYSHPVERKQKGLSGYEYFKTHFAVDVVCDQLCDQLNNG